ncbi:MAG: hypothetical protein GOV00_00240 [Candidatus Altiarchaeota archaeon]|nr:hypothetical protein [Candidatus Altiarchaeota archaeon]
MRPRQKPSYGKYAYPASYSYYPTRKGYAVKKKSFTPLILLVLGIVIAAYGLMSMPKIGPDLQRLATISPDKEVAAIVFCNPCSSIDGDSVGTGKVMVVDGALAVKQLSLLPGVKQIRLLGPV